jgi:hypothetical protein
MLGKQLMKRHRDLIFLLLKLFYGHIRLSFILFVYFVYQTHSTVYVFVYSECSYFL